MIIIEDKYKERSENRNIMIAAPIGPKNVLKRILKTKLKTLIFMGEKKKSNFGGLQPYNIK